MANNFVHDAAMVGSGASMTSGLLLFFSENATAIGAMTTVAVGLLTIVFMILNYRLGVKRLEFDRRQAKKAAQ